MVEVAIGDTLLGAEFKSLMRCALPETCKAASYKGKKVKSGRAGHDHKNIKTLEGKM